MEDSKPVLLNGNGTPYLAIFDGAGSPIMDIFNDLPIGMEVENFNYKYTEGKGDKGKFTIVTDFVDIVDHPSLQFKMPLKIQWGWIFSDISFKSSPVRLVNVKSHQIEFTPDGVRFTIEFADAKMFLEAEPSKFVGDKTDYLEVFNELAMGNMPMTVIDYSEKAGVHLEIRDNNPCDGKTEQREK